MASLNFSIIFVSCFLFGLLSLITTTEAQVTYLYHYCPNTTTFTPYGTYQANLNLHLSSLSSYSTRSNINGFYNTTAGSCSPASETIHGLFLCRGDVSKDACQECVFTASVEIRNRCPTEKVSIIWYDQCLLRYSNQAIFSSVEQSPTISMYNTQNITEQERFNDLLGNTMTDLASEAANDRTLGKKFAVKQANFTGFQTLYTLAQCTPDLTVLGCSTCLREAISNLPNCCGGKQGGRVLLPSCNVRYEVYQFYNVTATTPPPPPSPAPTSAVLGPPPAPTTTDKKHDVKVIIAIAVIVGTLSIAICTYFSWRWMAKHRARERRSKEVLSFNQGNPSLNSPANNMFGENMNQELPVFTFATLATATNNFDMANKLGQGGFGPVYRGKLPSGQEIAVKRLSRTSGQGLEEFMNEVVVISKLQHRNLVRILGCCVERQEKMLIYEYMPNKSLDAFLFDPLKHELLHWRKRFEIIKGIGRGLLYLHRDSRLRIIHRDLKASNILLDEELNPKISDFGMARIFVSDQDQAETTRVVGTYGYMSPEYAMQGTFSEKSDVFSFGVILLEIVSGRRNTSFYNDEQSLSLLEFVWKLWNEENNFELIDPVISDPNIRLEILRCIHVGLLCVQESAKVRPTVSTVLSMLTSEIHDLPTPKQPAFTERQIRSSNESAPNNQKRCSVNNVTITVIEGR